MVSTFILGFYIYLKGFWVMVRITNKWIIEFLDSEKFNNIGIVMWKSKSRFLIYPVVIKAL